MKFLSNHKPFVICALISIVALVGVLGCPRKTTSLAPPRGRDSNRGANEQVFTSVIDNFNRLENHFGQDSLAHLFGRLDSWIAEQQADPTWQEDAFFAEQEKSLTAIADNLAQFAKSLEKIIVADQPSDQSPVTPLTADDVQNAADLAKTLTEQLVAAYQTLGVRHFLECLQNVGEVESVLGPLANVAKTREMSEDSIREFFRGRFQPSGGDAMQLVYFFRSLSDTVRQFAETFRGSALNFRRLDADYLKQAFWCRSVSLWAGGRRQDEIERAKELFDWTIRNITLETAIRMQQGDVISVMPVMPQAPWESLLFGRGSVSDWAYVFVELLRQHRIDACIFLSDLQNPQRQNERLPWGVGVLLGGKVYVFLVRYGIPLVPEDEITLAPECGLVFGQMVTYNQLSANPDLLVDFLGEGFTIDQVNTLLEQTTLAIPANPIAGSQRILILEKALTGANKTVLFTSWSEQKKRFENALPGATVERWNYPFEADFQACLTRNAADPRMELFRIAADPQHPNPLWKGRVLFFSGRKTGEGGASAELQHACISRSALAALLDTHATAMTEPMTQLQAQIQELQTAIQGASEKDKPELQANLQELLQIQNQFAATLGMNFQGLQFQKTLFELTSATANYWLGQVHFEEALLATNANSRKSSLSAASDYVSKRIIDNDRAQQWLNGANYHLGRVSEMQENYEDAIRYYLTPTPEPDNIGRKFRARQLQRLTTESEPQESEPE